MFGEKRLKSKKRNFLAEIDSLVFSKQNLTEEASGHLIELNGCGFHLFPFALRPIRRSTNGHSFNPLQQLLPERK